MINTVLLLAGDLIRHLPRAMTTAIITKILRVHFMAKWLGTDKKIYFSLYSDRLDPFIDIFTNH